MGLMFYLSYLYLEDAQCVAKQRTRAGHRVTVFLLDGALWFFVSLPASLGTEFLGLWLPSSLEAELSEAMAAHEAGLVHVTVDAIEAAFTCVLPKGDVAFICENRLLICILSYHNEVIVELSLQVLVIEIGACIDKWLLFVGLFHHFQELKQRVAELLSGESGGGFHVYHRNEVLLFWAALLKEVFELGGLRRLRTIEMIGSYFEAMTTSHEDVVLEAVIFSVASLGSLDIDVGHIGIFAHRLPEDVALIVGDIYAMHMLAGIFTLHSLGVRYYGKKGKNEG